MSKTMNKTQAITGVVASVAFGIMCAAIGVPNHIVPMIILFLSVWSLPHDIIDGFGLAHILLFYLLVLVFTCAGYYGFLFIKLSLQG